MPGPIYFHPFRDRQHSTGVSLGGLISPPVLPSWFSLHAVAPFLGTVHYRYLWEMEENIGKYLNTFSEHLTNKHRIYVMGHCNKGEDSLSTDSGANDPDSKCRYDQLVQYFRTYGLQENSNAHIRVHACYSGSNYSEFREDRSFAPKVQACLYEWGYRGVTVRGYTVGVGIYFLYRWGAHALDKANNHAVEFTGPPAP